MSYLKRHPQVLAFLLLFTANFLGFLLLQNNAHDDRLRAYEGGVAICQATEDNRQQIIKYITAQTEPMPIPPNATPEQSDAIRQANERRARVRAGALDTFKPSACIIDLGLHLDEHGKLVPDTMR